VAEVLRKPYDLSTEKRALFVANIWACLSQIRVEL